MTSGNLTIKEKEDLLALEGIIRREMGSFMAVGNALLTIRDHGLYREGFKTFNDYCKGKWGMAKSYAYYLVTGSQVAANLSTAVDTMPPCEIQPIYEKQVRPLAQLEPAQQCEAWEAAVISADGKVVTYKLVKATVTELYGPAPPAPPKVMNDPHRESDAMYFATIAISQLTRIRDDDSRRVEAMERVIKWCNENLTHLKEKLR